MPERKLGLLAPRFDVRTFKLRDYLTLPPRPNMLNWIGPVRQWGMMGNDVAGDCVLAAFAHQLMIWTGNAGRLFTPTTTQVIRAYSDLTGYDPRTGNFDYGVDLLSALNYFRKVGVAGHKIYAYMAIEPADIEMVKVASWIFGNVVTGVALPNTASDQIDAGKPWDAASGFTGDAAPASWGRHCVPVMVWNDWYNWCVTWAQLQPMTWPFWLGYVEECYAVLSLDWINMARQIAPSGFNLQQLEADLNSL